MAAGMAVAEAEGLTGHLAPQAADDNLHPSVKEYTPWAYTIVLLAESALLKEEIS